MHRTDPDNTSTDIMPYLKKITSSCENFKREGSSPHRLKESFPKEDCLFNLTVAIEITRLEENSTLHVVDKDTKFNAACFLKSEAIQAVWNVFMNIWVSTYFCFPDTVATDQGPSGLVPTILVFVFLPRIPFIPKNLPTKSASMKASDEAYKDMTKISSSDRLTTALRSIVPSTADSTFRVGEEVLIYREKPVGKWVGQPIFRDVKNKMLKLVSGDRFVRASVDEAKI